MYYDLRKKHCVTANVLVTIFNYSEMVLGYEYESYCVFAYM